MCFAFTNYKQYNFSMKSSKRNYLMSEYTIMDFHNACNKDTYKGRPIELLRKIKQVSSLLQTVCHLTGSEFLHCLYHDGHDADSDIVHLEIQNLNRYHRIQKPMKTKSMQESGRCPVCKKPALLKCQKCKIEYYCSVEHQRENWSTHKQFCHN